MLVNVTVIILKKNLTKGRNDKSCMNKRVYEHKN